MFIILGLFSLYILLLSLYRIFNENLYQQRLFFKSYPEKINGYYFRRLVFVRTNSDSKINPYYTNIKSIKYKIRDVVGNTLVNDEDEVEIQNEDQDTLINNLNQAVTKDVSSCNIFFVLVNDVDKNILSIALKNIGQKYYHDKFISFKKLVQKIVSPEDFTYTSKNNGWVSSSDEVKSYDSYNFENVKKFLDLDDDSKLHQAYHKVCSLLANETHINIESFGTLNNEVYTKANTINFDKFSEMITKKPEDEKDVYLDEDTEEEEEEEKEENVDEDKEDTVVDDEKEDVTVEKEKDVTEDKEEVSDNEEDVSEENEVSEETDLNKEEEVKEEDEANSSSKYRKLITEYLYNHPNLVTYYINSNIRLCYH